MKRFDAGYFAKWYRSRDHRIGTRTDLARLVRFAVTAAEYVLARPVRSVLDVGAGEGRWLPVLREIRPHIKYVGVDPSEYAIARFGRTRNLLAGTATDLDRLVGERRFDLVVCCSVLNYVPRPVMRESLASIARHTGGLAYLEIFARGDDVTGDREEWHAESASAYRAAAREAGLIPCGLHCYVPDHMRDAVVALETAGER